MEEQLLYAIYEVLALYDEESDEFRLIDFAAAELAEMSAFIEQLLCQFLLILDFCYGDDGKASQMAVHEHGLSIGVADDAYARVALKLVEFRLEACPKVCAFEVVDASQELARFVQSGYATAFRAEMRLIVCAVKEVVCTLLFLYRTEETAHIMKIEN